MLRKVFYIFILTIGCSEEPTGPGDNDGIASKIAFLSNRTGSYQVFITNFDGANPQQLTTDYALGSRFHWSSDGHKIAYISGNRSDYQLNVIHDDGTVKEAVYMQFHSDFNPVVFGPSWSPDGQLLAIASQETDTLEIFVIDIETKTQRQLTQNFGYCSYPAWSPDGQRILFVSDWETIAVVNSDGTHYQNILREQDWVYRLIELPQWSSDGSKISFVAGIDRTHYEYYTMNADGSNLTLVLNNNRGVWSRHSDFLAYTSSNNGDSVLNIAHGDGQIIDRLSVQYSISSVASWMYDDSHLVFSVEKSGESRLARIHRDGTDFTLLTTIGTFPICSPVSYN